MTIRPPHDTTRFSIPAFWHRCDDGRSLLLEAMSPQGSGVFIRLKFGDSLVPGEYEVIWPDDTASHRGAMVAVRYVVREVPNTFVLDSGTVQITRGNKTLDAQIAGKGIENAMRMSASGDFRDVPLHPDTANCRYQP